MTAHVADFWLPSFAVAVIVAWPGPTAVTLPSASTVATASAELVQVTFGFEALFGATVAVSCSVSVPPIVRVSSVLSSVMPVTGWITVMTHVAVNLPSSVSAVIVAVPGPAAVTLPSASTVATASAELVQVTFGFEALFGATVAVSCSVSVLPIVSVPLVGSSVTPVTG